MTSTPRGRRSRAIAALIACFYAGAFMDWWLREKVRPASRTGPESSLVRLKPDATNVVGGKPDAGAHDAGHPVATIGEPTIPPDGLPRGEIPDPVAALQLRGLQLPIEGTDIEAMKGGFTEHRSGAGGHEHDAVDLLAPRNTPIHAVDDGVIAKLFYSKAGGITIYQYDPSERFSYYYAHLERYADGLADGQRVARGDVIGYVGTSGNAPPGTPHLHFAVYELTPEHRWWQGRAIDPYVVFRR
jgi:murein DD-endopeptidase MepM/ murein hydrolase activator NlpD